MSNYEISVLKNNINSLMHERRITQATLSENTGIPQSRISKILSGRTSDSFTIPQLVDIADYFEVSTDILLFGEEKMAEKQNKKRLSVKDVCSMFVQIDKTVPFRIEIKEFEEEKVTRRLSENFEAENSARLLRGEPIKSEWDGLVDYTKENVAHPLLFFLEYETSEEVGKNDFFWLEEHFSAVKAECQEINQFLKKYVEIRKLKDSQLIDLEMFEEIVSVHISKLSTTEIIDRWADDLWETAD